MVVVHLRSLTERKTNAERLQLMRTVIRALTIALMMEAVIMSETRVNFYTTARRNIPEGLVTQFSAVNVARRLHTLIITVRHRSL